MYKMLMVMFQVADEVVDVEVKVVMPQLATTEFNQVSMIEKLPGLCLPCLI